LAKRRPRTAARTLFDLDTTSPTDEDAGVQAYETIGGGDGRQGTAVAHDEGLVVVIDTELTPALRAEGDAREIQRAVQDLRRDAALELADRIELVADLGPDAARIGPFLDAVAAETLADGVRLGAPPAGWAQASVKLSGGEATIALRRVARVERPEPANA